ncbi:MAG: hypothetical protein AAGG01_02800 [Planctomycetota bacterium]
MNAWLREHGLKRHEVQRTFEALERHDVASLARWRDESGVTQMLRTAFDPPRNVFAESLVGEQGLPWDAIVVRWTALFAELCQSPDGLRGPANAWVLGWWLDRVRLWLEGEVRARHGAGLVQSLRAAYRRQAGHAPDRLALDAMFTAAVITTMDASAGFDGSQSVGAWLRGVAYHVARDHARVEGQRALWMSGDIEPDSVVAYQHGPGSACEAAEERAWLADRALRGVTLPGEAAIVASVLDGSVRSAESLSDELSISVRRVYKRTAAARRRLRAAMERLRGS